MSQTEEIEGIEEETIEEEAIEQTVDATIERRSITPEEAVAKATTRVAGAKERWAELRASGATDAHLRTVIGQILGNGASHSPADEERHAYSVEYKGGKSPRISWKIESDDLQTVIDEGRLSGKKLVEMVRKIYDIQEDGQPPIEATVPESDTIVPESGEIVPELAPEQPAPPADVPGTPEQMPSPPDRWQSSRNTETRNCWMSMDGDREEQLTGSLAEMCVELEKIREEKSKVVGGFTAKIKTKEAQVNKLAESIANKGEHTSVRCRWYYDYTNFRAQLRREDTDEVIEERAMNDSERQIALTLDEDRHPDDQEGRPDEPEPNESGTDTPGDAQADQVQASEPRVWALIDQGQRGVYGGKMGIVTYVSDAQVTFQPDSESEKVGEREEPIGVGREVFNKMFKPSGEPWKATCKSCQWPWISPGMPVRCPNCTWETIERFQLPELPENWVWALFNNSLVAEHRTLTMRTIPGFEPAKIVHAARFMQEGYDKGVVSARERERVISAEKSAEIDDGAATNRNNEISLESEVDESINSQGEDSPEEVH